MSDTPPCVLIVDDEPEIREYLAIFLETEGYELLSAGSGQEALAIVESRRIDLVITDVKMPNGDGLWLLDQIRDRDIESPAVILMSGYTSTSVAEAYARGAEALFPKPFQPSALLETVKRVLTPRSDRWKEKPKHGDRLRPVPAQLALKVSTPKLGDIRDREVSLVNIGRGGMFLAWAEKMPEVGEEIQFQISFVGDSVRQLAGSGRVRWVRKPENEDNLQPGIGVEFTHIDDVQTVNIQEILNFVQTREFIPRS